MTPKELIDVRVTGGMSVGAGLLAFIVIAALFIGQWAYLSWTLPAERDAWWRKEIAAKSFGVQNSLATSDAEIAVTDNQLIEALGNDNEKLAQLEVDLQRERDKPVPPPVVLEKTVVQFVKEPQPDVCPRVPAVCVVD